MASTYPKVIRNGKVAVLTADSHGSGWFTCPLDEAFLFDPDIVSEIETLSPPTREGEETKATLVLADLRTKYPHKNLPMKGLGSSKTGRIVLCVNWVPVGSKFMIHEYDGEETVWLENDMVWMTA